MKTIADLKIAKGRAVKTGKRMAPETTHLMVVAGAFFDVVASY